ncbi:AraC family transcriptional regulator [uncultured Acetatifactor sp.]
MTSQYFSSSFRKSTGMSPNEYRQQSHGGTPRTPACPESN